MRMKVLLSWLREFAPIEGDPVALGRADERPRHGGRVDRPTSGEGLDGIVVARVLDLRAHPERRPIQLVDVDTGDGEALQICCGAFNMAVGDLVPAGHLGTAMPNGMKIERRKLRGEWSNGMLCSGRELGLGDDHAGILILAARPRAGRRPARRARHRARRPLRPRDQPQPSRRHVGGRRRPRPRRPPAACRSRMPEPDGRPSRGDRRAGRRRRSRSSTPTCAAGSTPACSRASRSARRRRGSPTG